MEPPCDHDELSRCKDTLRRLEEEITLLRNASLTFGDLADRLNRQVQILRAELRRRDEGRTKHPAPRRRKRKRRLSSLPVWCVLAVVVCLAATLNR